MVIIFLASKCIFLFFKNKISLILNYVITITMLYVIVILVSNDTQV